VSAQDKIAEIEARRAARQAKLAVAKEEQYALDLEALDALEVEHGDGAVARLDPERYVEGLPTFVVLKTPSGAQYKRFCDQLAKQAKDSGKARQDAQDLLAKSCWVYPKQEEQAAMLADFPGILTSIFVRAMQLVEAKQVDLGKE
jgi:hypothetical protein